MRLSTGSCGWTSTWTHYRPADSTDTTEAAGLFVIAPLLLQADAPSVYHLSFNLSWPPHMERGEWVRPITTRPRIRLWRREAMDKI